MKASVTRVDVIHMAGRRRGVTFEFFYLTPSFLEMTIGFGKTWRCSRLCELKTGGIYEPWEDGAGDSSEFGVGEAKKRSCR